MPSKAAWVKQLRDAQFRNVPFKVDSHTTTGGRRIANHEFPGRDEPYAEDLGRRARTWTVQAYVIGDNYFAKRDALISACEKDGAAELVHPYLGSKNVVVTEFSLSETRTDGGFVTFSITFAEAGKKAQPLATRDLRAGLSLSADAASAASTKAFKQKFSVLGSAKFVVDSATKNVVALADMLQNATSGVTGDPLGIARLASRINGLKATAGDIINSPDLLASTFNGVLGDLRSALSLAGIFADEVSATKRKALDSAQSRRTLGVYDTMAKFQKGDPLPTQQTPSRKQEYENTLALRTFVQTLSLFEFSKAASEATFGTTAEAAQVRDNLFNSLDEQLDQTTSDEVFSAIQDVKANVVLTIPDPDSDTPRLASVTLPDTVPSLVLVYDLYESADLEDDLVTRNKIRNPAFLPVAEPVEVLAGV